jgi:hypothetical protein
MRKKERKKEIAHTHCPGGNSTASSWWLLQFCFFLEMSSAVRTSRKISSSAISQSCQLVSHWSVAADVAAIWQLRDFVCLFAVELQLHTT